MSDLLKRGNLNAILSKSLVLIPEPFICFVNEVCNPSCLAEVRPSFLDIDLMNNFMRARATLKRTLCPSKRKQSIILMSVAASRCLNIHQGHI